MSSVSAFRAPLEGKPVAQREVRRVGEGGQIPFAVRRAAFVEHHRQNAVQCVDHYLGRFELARDEALLQREQFECKLDERRWIA